jgi:hypothetical protein
MSSRKTLDIDLLTLRKVYPVGPTNRPQPANTVFTVNPAGEGTWVNPIDNLVANGINPPLPTQLNTMQTQIATLNGAVFGGIDPHDEFVTKTEFMSTLVNPLPVTILAPKGVIAGPDPSNNMLGIVSKSGLSLQNSGFNYWIATGGSDPLKQILTTADFVTFTGQRGIDFNTAPSGITPQCYTVETNGSIWVAGGTSNNTGTVKPILYSNDGITWSGVTWNGGIMQSACYTIKYNGSMWIAAGGAGLSNPIYYSIDGINWSPSTDSTSSSPFATIKALDYSNGQWYAIGDDRYMYTSINGINWAKNNTAISTISNTTYALRVYTIPSDSGIYNINSVETLILIANSQALYKYNISTNTVTPLIPNFSCYAVETNSVMWVAIGKGVNPNTNKLYYTSDITASSGWTPVSGVLFTTGTYVTWTGSEWLCTGNDASGNNYIYSSSNGISWTLKNIFDSNNTIGVEVINQILTLAPAVYVAPGQQRVGVFTTEPNAALDVQGDVIVRNNLTVQNKLILNQDLDVNTIYTNNIGTRTGGTINMNSVALANVSGILYPNTIGSNSYLTGVNTNGNFAISYGTSDVLVFDGSGSVSTNIPIAFNNPIDKILQGRIATDGFNSGYLYAEAINTFMISNLRAQHVSAQFDVSGTVPSITFFDPTTIQNSLTVNGSIDTGYANISVLDTINTHLSGTLDASNINVTSTLNAAYANIPVLDTMNANVYGLLDASNINVSGILDAENLTINNNLEVYNNLSANTVSTRTCSINAGPSSSDTTLILGQADPLKYWQLYSTSTAGGGLTAGNFSLWSYDDNSGFIGKAIDIDASCSSITLCNGDVSGNVYVHGPSGPGRVYDTIYNPVSSAINNVTTRTYNTAGTYYYPIPTGNYSITIEYCGGGGGGGYTAPDPNPGDPRNGGGGGSGTIKTYSFTTTPLTSGYNIAITIGAGGGAPVTGAFPGGDTTIQLIYYTLVSAPGGSAASGIDGGIGGIGGFGGTDTITIGRNGSNNDTSILSSNQVYNGDGFGGGNGLLYGGAGGNGSKSGFNDGAYYTPPQPGQDGYAVITLTKLS